MQITLFLLVQNLLFGILFVDCTSLARESEPIFVSKKKANTDLFNTWNTVYVDYPGVPEGLLDRNEKSIIKIYNEASGDKPVLEYEVPKREETKKKIYRFVMRDHKPKDGKYSSQTCERRSLGRSSSYERKSLVRSPTYDECSQKTTPVELESGRDSDGNLYGFNCTRKLKTGDEKVLSSQLEPVNGTLTDEYVKELESTPGTIANQYGIDKNQGIFNKDSDLYTYFAVRYPAKKYREWFRMEDSCTQKYTGVILTYIVNNKSKLVLKKGKGWPNLPKSLYEKYLGLNPEEKEDTGELVITEEEFDKIPYTPIEILVKINGIKLPTANAWDTHKDEHNVYHMACMKTNDGTTPKIKHCAEAFIHKWDYITLEYDIQPRSNDIAE